MKTFIWFIMLCSAAIALGQLPGQIIKDPSNPHGMVRFDPAGNHTPVYLCGIGDPEGFLYGDSLRTPQQIVDKCRTMGGNAIYMMAVRSHGGDGSANQNPFINNNPLNGVDDAVLSEWLTMFQEMDANQITVYFFFYDDSARPFGLKTDTTVSAAERVFFETVVNKFEGIKNLIWVIAEEYNEAFTQARIAALSNIIKDADDNDHIVSVHRSGTTMDAFSGGSIDQHSMFEVASGTDIHTRALTAYQNANRTYGVVWSENFPNGFNMIRDGNRIGLRRSFWAMAMAGVHNTAGGAYNPVFTTTGSQTYIPTDDMHRDMKRTVDFFESVPDYNFLIPDDSRALGDALWVTASSSSGIAYAISLASTGTRTMGIKNIGPGLNETKTYDVKWYKPDTGASLVEENVSISNSTDVVLTVPAAYTGEVAVYINGGLPNIAPLAVAQELSTPVNTALQVTLTHTDADGPGPYTYTVTESPATGTLTGTGNELTYTPATGIESNVTFKFTVSDGVSTSLPAQVKIRVGNPLNVPPTALNASLTTRVDTSLTLALQATDPDGPGPNTYTITQQPTRGQLSVQSNDVVYTPNAGYTGADSFKWRVNDGISDSNEATINITVQANAGKRFKEVAGLVSMEAEFATNRTPAIILTTKAEATAKLINLLDDADGSPTHEEALADILAEWDANVSGERVIQLPTGRNNINDVDFDVEITTPGEWVIVLKMYSHHHKTNGLFLGWDSEFTNAKLKVQKANAWHWLVIDGDETGQDTSVKSAPWLKNITTGRHVLKIRSSGETPVIDKILLMPKSFYVDLPDSMKATLFGNYNTLKWGYGPDETALGESVSRLGFQIPESSTSEGSGQGQFKVVRTGSTAQSASISFTTTQGSAGSPGDFTLTTDTLTWGVGEDGARFVTVPFVNDGVPEISESFTVSLSNPVNATLTAASHVATITNDDFINSAPVAHDVTLSAFHGESTQINLPFTDDGLPTASTISYSILTQPVHGVLTGSGPSVTYTPSESYTGPDSFTWRLNDGELNSNVATVSLTVNAARQTLLNDDFSDNNSDGWLLVPLLSASTARWAVTNGRFSQTANANTNLMIWDDSAAQGWTNYQFSATVNATDDDDIGIAAYYNKTTGNHYRLSFNVTTQTLTLALVEGTSTLTITPLASVPSVVAINTDYDLSISIEDGTIKGFLNGTALITVSHSGLTSGTVAFFNSFNSGSHYDDVVVTNNNAVTSPTAPVAYAGSNQTLTDSDASGNESVTLDGTGSVDDAPIVSYVWTLNAAALATGVQPTVQLPVGVHTITLTVTDADGLTDTATVVITVEAASVPATGPFLENSGLIVIEAEHFHENIVGTSGPAIVTDTTLPGYAGSGYVGTPDVSSNSAIFATASILRYKVKVTNAGSYTVWLRRVAKDGDSNSAFINLKDATAGLNFDNFANSQTWSWFSGFNPSTLVTLPFVSGLNEFEIRVREDGYQIDRIVLTTNVDFNPSTLNEGTGPAESLRDATTSDFESWLEGFSWPHRGSDDLPNADPNDDRLPNILAYALHIPPLGTSNKRPTLLTSDGESSNIVHFTFRKRRQLPDHRIVIRSSPDLVYWTDETARTEAALAAPPYQSDPDGDGQADEYRVPFELPSNGCLFFDLSLRSNP